MKIAIHKSSWGFSEDWIGYCEKKQIPYKIVDCYASDIVSQLSDCDALLWHHHHSSAKDVLFAKGLLFSLEQSGKKVFPDFKTGWHFDDKVGQKYLLEAVGAPIPSSWVFYEKEKALAWAEEATYPKVFKLRAGAGAANVKLVKSKSHAVQIIKKSFGRGFSVYAGWNNFKDNWRQLRLSRFKWMSFLKSLWRLFASTKFARLVGRQKGYVFFQEFIPDNYFDVRVVSIGDRAFAIKRIVRPGDFRASGSGNIKYQLDQLDERCVKIAFEVTRKLGAQCVAYDFVFDQDNPVIVEVNYGFAKEGYLPCPGYWDRDLNWHAGKFNQVEWILEDLVACLKC